MWLVDRTELIEVMIGTKQVLAQKQRSHAYSRLGGRSALLQRAHTITRAFTTKVLDISKCSVVSVSLHIARAITMRVLHSYTQGTPRIAYFHPTNHSDRRPVPKHYSSIVTQILTAKITDEYR
jgi:hypothetical protein